MGRRAAKAAPGTGAGAALMLAVAWMLMPMSAALSAPESLAPSPVMQTT